MKRRSKASRNQAKAPARGAAKLKHRTPSKGGTISKRTRSPPSSQETEVTRLSRELGEAAEQQTAMAEVLQIISSSPGELESVFESLLQGATSVCHASFGNLVLSERDGLRVVAMHNAVPAVDTLFRGRLLHPHPQSPLSQAAKNKRPVHVDDLRTTPPYLEGNKAITMLADVGSARTFLCVPLLKKSEVAGVIVLYRNEVRPFTGRQIALVENFAAQAVIAIENARLLDELRQRTDDLSQRTTDLTEALEQQTATSEVLKVISGSSADLQPVFDAMLANATRLCEASFGTLWLNENSDQMRMAALHGRLPEAFHGKWSVGTVHRPSPSVPTARAFETRKPVQITDLRLDRAYIERDPLAVASVDGGGIRSLIAVPLLKDGTTAIGAITIYRQEVRPFTNKQIALVQNFANQAVIAVENARLLNELRQRTSDLSELLEQQTATGEILSSMSGSTADTKPVFDAIVRNLFRLFGTRFATIQVLRDGLIHLAAVVGEQGFEKMANHFPRPLDDKSLSGMAVLSKEPFQFAPVVDNPAVPRLGQETARDYGYNSVIFAPMIQGQKVVGAIGTAHREPKRFSDKQVALLKSFANQAVIAIENARVLTELHQRTDDLTEALEQQTATAEVLAVISSSKFELQPILQSVVDTAARLCRADAAVIFRLEDGIYRFAAGYSLDPAYLEIERRTLIAPGPGTLVGRAAMSRQLVRIDDAWSDPAYEKKEQARLGQGFRSMMGVPLRRDGEAIGVIGLARSRVEPFAEREVDLVTTFADQAVIAIENVRLFEAEQQRTGELAESLEQQTATSEVLEVISRSAFNLQAVFETVAESSVRLCGADRAFIFRFDGELLRMVVGYNSTPGFVEWVAQNPIRPGRHSASARAALERRTIHIADVLADPEYVYGAKDVEPIRTVLGVPILKGDDLLGVMMIYRLEVRPFTDRQIALVETFADQAAIAIENVRLFESVEARTRELAKSLDDLRTTQDRLVQTQKLASLGQLTAGIAHEIKNPLNFVNNFSGVSVELIDELQEALGRVQADDGTRGEIAELADTLRDNLGKIVQHGKRADSIVKNMLLHSREGSSEHRPVDINALVDEALNLAYHGARAEKQAFNITLERSLAPDAGQVDCFPQEITRVLLNLISNGFYAAGTRKDQATDSDFEPILTITTRNLGDRVEIRIHDNGIGIPPEVRDKMFNPFFTTKPAGEGTGLGLSISHDIIVKQHSGSIEVDTRPGEFTEFRIVLPRSASANKSGERA
jgi:GAF domain-containing protein